MLITIVGVSGTGKTSLSQNLQKNGFELIPSITTREPRTEDLPGAYEFVSKSEFKKLESRGMLYESTEYHGHYYGTKLDSVLKSRYQNMIAVVDIAGAIKFKFEMCAIVCLLTAEHNDLLKRLGDSETRIKRLQDFEAETRQLRSIADLEIFTSGLEPELICKKTLTAIQHYSKFLAEKNQPIPQKTAFSYESRLY